MPTLHGEGWMAAFNGNINLVYYPKLEEIHAYIDARQRGRTLKLFHDLDNTKGAIRAILINNPHERIFYSPSQALIAPTFTNDFMTNQSSVVIDRKLLWSVRIGRTKFLHRRYIGREDKDPGLPKHIETEYDRT